MGVFTASEAMMVSEQIVNVRSLSGNKRCVEAERLWVYVCDSVYLHIILCDAESGLRVRPDYGFGTVSDFCNRR